MRMTNRRDFLRAALSATAAGAALAFPPVIRRALAIPAHRRTGTIADVEHVVILMQENRSFDHYFGTLSGVRGFGDKNGRKHFFQREPSGKTLHPFHLP